MNKKLLLIPLAIVIIIAAIAGAKSKNKVHGDKCVMDVVNEVKSDSYPKNFILIMDNSGSMKGYVDFASKNNPDGFKDGKRTIISTVSRLLDNVSKHQCVTSTICANVIRDKDKFLDDFQNSSLFNGQVTEVGDMLNSAAEKANDTTVCAIVSDMVMSAGSKKAKVDEFYNMHHLEDLAADIYSTATNIKENNMDVLLVRCLSDYNGSYYVTNREKKCDAFKDSLMINRPYYIAFVGKADYLKNILDNCVELENEVKVFSTLDVNNLKQQTFEVVKEDNAKSWMVGSGTAQKYKEDELQIWSNTDLKDMQSTFTFKFDNIIVPKFLEQNIVGEELSLGLVSNIVCTNNSCSVTLNQYSALPKKALAEIELQANKSNWCEDMSIVDDATVTLEAMEGKTWGITHITNAIKKAYGIEMGPQKIGYLKFNISKE